MKTIAVFCIVLFFQTKTQAQHDLLFSNIDTLKYNYRSGEKIDSIDLLNSFHLSTIPGGGFNTHENTFNAKEFYKRPSLIQFRNHQVIKDIKFSALPYLGFTYSFGTTAKQFFDVKYTQAFGNHSLLNLHVFRNSSADVLRNGNFKRNYISGDFRRSGKFYSVHISGLYASDKIGQNGGVDSLEQVETLGILFVPVRLENAQSQIQQGELRNINYFNLFKDSLKGLGSILDLKYLVNNRIYSDNGSSVFENQNIFIDSFETRDQYQVAEIRSGGGFYFKKKQFYIDAQYQNRYWDLQNLGNHKYQVENNLLSELSFVAKKIAFKNYFDFNIFGAKNEFQNESKISWKSNKIAFGGQVVFKALLPEPYQRYYFANNISYSNPDMELQKTIFISGNAEYKIDSSKYLKIELSSLQMTDHYFFINDNWNNDSIKNAQVHSLIFSGAYNFGVLHIHPALHFNFCSDEFNFAPNTNLRTRIFLKGNVFKAKKLATYFGVDLSYISSYSLLAYNETLDVLTPYGNNVNSLDQDTRFDPQFNLSVFGGFGIDVFRMYFKVENLGYLWNSPSNQQLFNYPIHPGNVRIGLTWDFFN